MEKVILIGIFALAILWIIIIAITLILEHEEKENDQDYRDEQFNNGMISKCLQARKTKQCPGCCEKCSWGLSQKNGVIEFRGKR
jgi:hypothetical protein